MNKINIKKYKCFDSLKVESLKRVNLIGGKNNVGKTAFMEACYIATSQNTQQLYMRILEVEVHRDFINHLRSFSSKRETIEKLIKENVDIAISTDLQKILIKQNQNRFEVLPSQGSPMPDGFMYENLVSLLDLSFQDVKFPFSPNFITAISDDNKLYNTIISQLKFHYKYDTFNTYIKQMYGIDKIDTISDQPHFSSNNKWSKLSHYGQGIKTFVNVLGSILCLKDEAVFIDEIENGIHYSLLDQFWEMILRVSKEQNVQLFATTHSKECIESYARVSEKSEEKEISFINLSQNKKKSIVAIILDSEMFQSEIEQNHEVRAW
ncbi:MAG: hypothetical protein QG567_697 [Campylobacterota bacterium]|nr:hypothetical protein [Campylobacterota bacterium]